MTDSYNYNGRALPDEQYGTAMRNRASGRWDTATITGYSAATQAYQVRGQRTGLLQDVPRLARGPGDAKILPPNTIVAIHDELGYWVIDGVLKFAPLSGVTFTNPQISEIRGIGGESPAQATPHNAASSRGSSDPLDMLQGDDVTVGPLGNMMGVLQGGMNVMKSSPVAQIRTHALQDLVEIISASYRHITSMGDLRIQNDAGKTSLVWRAGTEQQSQDWTVRLDVGATGDLFNFEVTTPSGNTLARIHITADGKLELLGVSGVDVTTGAKGTRREDVAGDQVTNVLGAWELSVNGDAVNVFSGSHATQVSQNNEVSVGNNQQEVFGNNQHTYVGGVTVEKIQGGTEPAGGVVAKKIQTINGHIVYDIANPSTGAVPNGQSETHVNWAGGYYFVLAPSADGPWSIITNKDGGVHLGANGSAIPDPTTGGFKVISVAPFTAMIYEYFESMMKVLVKWADTHTHATAVGPSTPPVVPLDPLVGSLIPMIKSKRVKIGM